MDEVWLGFEHGFGYSTLMRLRWRTKWVCDGEKSAATGGRLGEDLNGFAMERHLLGVTYIIRDIKFINL